MPRSNEHTFLQQVLRDDPHAVAFIEALSRISQTLDDLIDGDQPISKNQVVSAFWESLIELPANPFYRQHEPYLRPLMAQALQDWRTSLYLEATEDHHQRTLAFVLRDQLAGVIIQCAYLVGGETWMTRVSVAIRQHVHEDSLDDYLADLDGTSEVHEGGPK
jgi:hypothetical protein